MVKMFFVEENHVAHSGGLWYAPGILMVVEPNEKVDIYGARDGVPETFKGRFTYDALELDAPPAGLLCAGHLAGLSLHEIAGTQTARRAARGHAPATATVLPFPVVMSARRPVVATRTAA